MLWLFKFEKFLELKVEKENNYNIINLNYILSTISIMFII
jgi:hypothetical protein